MMWPAIHHLSGRVAGVPAIEITARSRPEGRGWAARQVGNRKNVDR
jgi:hypothetical protein